jgi:tetratricopeptide (TPR) repeat protein
MISYMDNQLKLSATFLAVGLILSGCGASGDNSVGKVASPVINKQIFTAEAGLTARQRFSKALEKLENGEEGQALAELEAYLIGVPRSNSARNLVEQISTDSSQYFPSENFKVNLTSGTSLSTLAKKYLGSALKFYALAKYNNISNPSRVNIGQEIRIPLTQLARTQRDADNSLDSETLEETNEQSNDELAITEQTSETQNTANDALDVLDDISDSVDLPESTPVLADVIPDVPEETAESILSDLQELTQNNDYTAAIEKVTKLKTFGQLNTLGRELAIATYTGRAKEIAETNNILAATYYAQVGQLKLVDEETFAAFENFRMATDLDENNDQAMEEMLVLQKEIADKYHREALSAYRRQDLDLAIEKWDMVLTVNPDHSSAKLYRVKALDLMDKLNSFNQNQNQN